MKVESFGQVASPQAEVTLPVSGDEVASGTVPELQPFCETVVELNPFSQPSKQDFVTLLIKAKGSSVNSFSTPSPR